MPLILAILICLPVLTGCVSGTRTVRQTPTQERRSVTRGLELALRHLDHFEALEADTGSEQIQTEMNYVISSAVPLDQPRLYRRPESGLSAVPLVIAYHPALNDGVVRRINYEWGGQEGSASWVRQPIEGLGAFRSKYQSLRDEVVGALGEPSQSLPLSSSTVGGITTWRRGDTWTVGETKVELAVSFSEPLAEGTNRTRGLVRYNEVHRIRATISHGL